MRHDDQAAAAFSALGHENRVQVMRLLVQAGLNGLTVGQMRDALGVPATTFAHHLKALVLAGLVKQEKDGREVISTADYGAIQSLAAFLMEDCCKGAFAPARSIEEDIS